jgi:uncharacterized protein DUF1801
MIDKISEFYFASSEPNKSCFLALRDILLKYDPEISETVKYNMPCFLYKKHILCYLWSDKATKEPYILWSKGHEIDHPLLETGTRKKMKILRVDPAQDLPIKTIHKILQLALELY